MTPEIEKHLSANITMSRKEIIINNFLGGISWGLGTVVGASAVVGVFGYILNSLGVFQAVGTFFSAIINLGQQIQTVPSL